MLPRSWALPQLTLTQRRTMDIVAFFLVLLLGLMMAFMYGTQGFAYYFGMFLYTFILGVFFVILAQPTSIWHRLLAFKPLACLGRRSYSYYLWFYPIYLLVPKISFFRNVSYQWMFVIQFIIILIFSEVSYRIFERKQLDLPIGQDFNYKKMRHQFNILSRSGKALVSVKIMTFIYIFVAVFGILGLIQSKSATDDINELETLIKTNQNDLALNQQPSTENRAINNIEGLSQEVLLYANGLGITFFGDSTLLSSANQLRAVFPKAIIDGQIGRQLYNSYRDLATMQEQGLIEDTIVFMLGANGTFNQMQIDDIISMLGNQQQIYFVTSNAQRTWTVDANQQLKRASERYGNVQVIDWASYSAGKDEWLRESDHAHPTTVGAQEMAKFIAQEIYRLR